MNKHAAHFRNKGFLLFDIIEEMLPSGGKGTHVFCPGTKQSKPMPAATPQSMPASTPAISAPPPATPTGEASSLMPSPQMPAAVTSRDNPIDTPATQSAPTDILNHHPHHPHSLHPQAMALILHCAAASDASQKCVCGPSVTVAMQLESVKTMKHISDTVDGIMKAFFMLGITITTADICQEAIAILKGYEDEFSVDNLLNLGAYLTEHRQKAIVFIGIGDVACKCWLQKIRT
ncbi:hypothetical protein SCLCIDRAFT_25570 [Scleroderma citrinum Foug A]|uniref:Uncharacterized protein n=1 Tax=Scleroderma citrinum Foug A TaxID=1036808 RepID=A0A0C3E0Z1_9AGAM|nr:hypothetical protein SCLCIDRAFT_25570 [Scleroderma citrinum Foug A]